MYLKEGTVTVDRGRCASSVNKRYTCKPRKTWRDLQVKPFSMQASLCKGFQHGQGQVLI